MIRPQGPPTGSHPVVGKQGAGAQRPAAAPATPPKRFAESPTTHIERRELPGEELPIAIVKEGKESGQGVGYLPDGTMVIIESGRKHIGETLDIVVTSALQTSAGRLVFAKLR